MFVYTVVVIVIRKPKPPSVAINRRLVYLEVILSRYPPYGELRNETDQGWRGRDSFECLNFKIIVVHTASDYGEDDDDKRLLQLH